MPTLAALPEPVIEFVRRDADDPDTELLIELRSPVGPVPHTLVIAGGWDPEDGGRYDQWDRYEVREASGYGGRTFRVWRDPFKLLHLPPGGDRSPEYEVTVTPDGGWCSCRGFTLANEGRRACKHLLALGRFVRSGAFDNLTNGETRNEQATEPDGGREAEAGSLGGDWQADRFHPGWL